MKHLSKTGIQIAFIMVKMYTEIAFSVYATQKCGFE